MLVVPGVSLAPSLATAQVETVPITNQVYEFLDRLGVMGILPLYSSASVPISRREVAGLLATATRERERLSPTEQRFLDKFRNEFAWELGIFDDPFVLFGSHASSAELFEGAGSDREKFLYAYRDSSATLFMEFVGSAEYRAITGDSYGKAHVALGSIGGRFRGTIRDILGYSLQSTNGQVWGDRAFALSDRRLAENVKFNDLASPNFDQTEAALRIDAGAFTVQLGREFTRIGPGYSDKLILSDNAPVFDAIRLDAHYRSFRLTFLHGSILQDAHPFPGLDNLAPEGTNKYLALHRFQFSLFDVMNFAASEMVIYQRVTPEYAYLNPVNFFKSSEHQLRDRDNAILVFDTEVFPVAGLKAYGTWLIDDITFSRMGTGWWGNEFGWQGGVYLTDVGGWRGVDAIAEYTRLEPYVYSNRLQGNDYTHNDQSLGHHLEPNSDEWFLELRYRATERLRLRLAATGARHGANITGADSVVLNVGGSALQGHRAQDAETVHFLDGLRETMSTLRFRCDYEAVTNIVLTGLLEYRARTTHTAMGEALHLKDTYGSVALRLEF